MEAGNHPAGPFLGPRPGEGSALLLFGAVVLLRAGGPSCQAMVPVPAPRNQLAWVRGAEQVQLTAGRVAPCCPCGPPGEGNRVPTPLKDE